MGDRCPRGGCLLLGADGTCARRGGPAPGFGRLDFRGTLGVEREAPVGFAAIRVSFELETDADDEQLATLQRLTERYCVVYQTLANRPALATAIVRA